MFFRFPNVFHGLGSGGEGKNQYKNLNSVPNSVALEVSSHLAEMVLSGGSGKEELPEEDLFWFLSGPNSL